MKDYKKEIAGDLARVHKEFENLREAQKLLTLEKREEVTDLLLSGTAYHLQLLYTGFEKIAEKTLAANGIVLTNDGSYHKNLLDKYFEKFLFTVSEQFLLKELRGFRHVVRSAYGFDLAMPSITDKLTAVMNEWPAIESKIRNYVGLP
ncbi:MAG: hypothetical protein LBK71_02980 [Verrucomicrobiales bacterium]|jgi:hypothetical protein|nr:hypothetical protein [Verrucomicrobiales bacterium]